MNQDFSNHLPIMIPPEFSPTGEVIIIPLAEISEELRDAFPWAKHYLIALAQTGNKTIAAQAAGVHFGAIKKANMVSPEFAELEEMAREISIGRLEAVARQRAEKNSDLLMIFLLKAMNPAKYRDKYEPVARVINDYVIDITPKGAGAGTHSANRDDTAK